ncbi:MAG: prolyl oligopeptidase family serine peptidase [Candidatus Krumholzibacteriia bacterium]
MNRMQADPTFRPLSRRGANPRPGSPSRPRPGSPPRPRPWRTAAAGVLVLALGAAFVPQPCIAAAGPVTADRVLVLGPLPLSPDDLPGGSVAAEPGATAATDTADTDGPAAFVIAWGDVQPVAEIASLRTLPAAGGHVAVAPGLLATWRAVNATDGKVPLDGGPGVYWTAVRLRQDRHAEVRITVTGASALYVDGELVASEQADDDGGTDDPPESSATVTGGRGLREVRVRTVVAGGAGTASLALAAAAVPEDGPAAGPADDDLELGWTTAPQRPFADIDAARELPAIGDVAIATDGRTVVRRLTRRQPTGEETRSSVEVLDAAGGILAADLGGPDARPLAFAPDGLSLLLRRRAPGGHDVGDDLLLWAVPRGPSRIVLEDEPGFAFARFSPDGRFLLVASSRGFETPEAKTDGPRRLQHPRQRITDFTPGTHLHLVDLESGLRRRLTLPGDWVLDDAVFLPDGERVVYGRTLPQAERPWFRTELRLLQLGSGADSLLATFTGGWEVRPQHFAPRPDGSAVAFLGPPGEVGGGRPERNVYQKQVWLLMLPEGRLVRITRDQPYAFESGNGLPGWDGKGRKLLVQADEGSRARVVALMESGGEWHAMPLETAGETVAGCALSPGGAAVAYVAGGPTSPPALYRQTMDDPPVLLEEPAAQARGRWLLASARDASFTGPGGETIEAWWYAPVGPFAPRHREARGGGGAGDGADDPGGARPGSNRAGAGTMPLVVYTYGGSVPSSRAFNTTHQFLAANGYAVLVVNPRGAGGYGEAFADVHAGDWGPAAAADVLAGVEAFLAEHPEVDRGRIGIYGGSYGGFITQYLVTATDVFAAAVSLYGISDLATYWGQGAWGWTYGDMALAGRTPWADPGYFVERSPLFRAQHVQTPLLLMHGDADANVTPGESAQLFTALAVQGKPVELVTFPGEGHGLGGTFENFVRHRTMLLEWFDRFLRDQPRAWEARWR